MPTLEQIARKFASDYPTPSAHPNGGANTWDQWCGAAMWRFCDAYGTAPTGDVRSAYIVYERSTIVSKDASKALPGDFHFWDIAGRGNGHVMVDILGGGTRTFGGTASATSISGATALGFLSVDGYTKAKRGRAKYLGFSRRYANGDVTQFTPTAASAAANNLTPIGDDDMSAEAERNIHNIYQAMFYGASWTLDGKAQTFKYGVLPIVAHNQTLIAQLAGKVGALVVAVNQISAGEPLNMTAIEDAAERGAKEALDGITVTITT